MANEIEFRVTGTYDGDAAIAKAKADEEDLRKGADKASQSVKGLGDSLDKGTDRAKAFGGATRTSTAELKLIDAEIGKVKASIRDLGLEFARTSDATERVKIKEKLKVEQSTLSDLQRVRRSITGIAEDAAKAGGTFASVFQGGIIDAFRALPSEAKLALGAGLIATVASVAPLIGATVSAAILLGVGGGGLAAGIALAAKDPAVVAAWTDTGRRISEKLTDLAKPFRSELVETAGIFESAFDRVSPRIGSIFAKLAPEVSHLAQGLASAVEKALPGIEHAVDAAIPVIDALVENLPAMGKAAGMFFDAIAAGGPGAAKALTFVLLVAEATVVIFGKLFEELSKVFDGFSRLSLAVGGIFFSGLRDGEVFAKTLDNVNQQGQKSIIWIDGFSHEVETTAHTMDDFGKVGGNSLYLIDQKARDALATVDRLNKAFDELFNTLMSVDEATIQYQQAVDDLAAKWDKHGKSLDANTQAGRDNLNLINTVIQAIEDEREAAIRAGNGTQEAYDKANAAYLAQLKNLREQLKALGANTSAVDALIAKYEQLAKPLIKHITVVIDQVGSVSSQGVISGGDQRTRVGAAYAHGGVVRAAASGMVLSGTTRVSERGRELALLAPGMASLPPGSTVMSAGDTSRALGGAGGGGRLAIDVSPAPGAGGDFLDALVRELRYRVRTNSGSAEAFWVSDPL